MQSCNGAGLGVIRASGYIMGAAGLPKVVGGQMVPSNDPDVGYRALENGVFLAVLGFCFGLMFP